MRWTHKKECVNTLIYWMGDRADDISHSIVWDYLSVENRNWWTCRCVYHHTVYTHSQNTATMECCITRQFAAECCWDRRFLSLRESTGHWRVNCTTAVAKVCIQKKWRQPPPMWNNTCMYYMRKKGRYACILRGAFYFERFRTWLVQLSSCWYFAHNSSNNCSLACCSSDAEGPVSMPRKCPRLKLEENISPNESSDK